METWLVLATAALIGMLVVAIIAHVRRRAAEATVLSIGELTSTNAVGTDLVREVRQSFERAAESEAREAAYRGALAGASIGIAIVDASGDIQFANPVADGMLVGGGESAVLRARVSALVRRVREHGGTEHFESDIHDPIRKVLTTTAVSLSEAAGSEGTVAVYITDLSDRKRVDAMRTDFVANASHELKTPLGALSILAETLAETDSEEARTRLAGRLRDEAIRMAHVIDDVVRLAETESLGTEFEMVDVSELVDDAVDSVATLAASKGIDLVRGDVVDGVVEASPQQVVSAVRNLLENAITYTAVKDDGGVVTYHVRREEELMCIEVEDTGVGIPDRYVGRVFERFFRVDRARSRESGGTGLGLSIVKNVAQAHGGTVRLTSEVGVGSIFTFCIPEVTEDPT